MGVRVWLAGLMVWCWVAPVGLAHPSGAGGASVRARHAVRALPALVWRSRGIGGGGAFFAPAPGLHDPQRLFVTSDMGGVYRSEDSGRSWRMLRWSRLRGGVTTPVQFTSSPSVLYAIDAGEDLAIPVVSRDGGVSWSPLATDPTGGEAYSLLADPASTQRLLLSSYDTLYFSADGGATFHQVHQAHDEHVAGVFWDGDTILVGARDGLLVSTDGGATFSLSAAAGLPADEEMVSFAGLRVGTQVRLWAVTLGAGDVWPGITGGEMWSYQNVYRRDWSGGGSWTAVGASIPGDVLPFFVAVGPGDLGTVWLAGGNTALSAPAVLRSTDGGATWVDVFRTENNANIATGWSGFHGDTEWWWGEYALGFAVSPADPDRAVLTDLGFIHVTEDGGASWRQAYVDPADQNPPGAPTPKARAYHGVGAEDTSVWWLHWVDDQTLMAALTDIRGIRSSDGGLSWTSGFSLGLPHNSTYHVVEHPVSGRLFAATSSVHDLYQSTYLADDRIDRGTGAVVYSDDGGATWQILHDFGHPVIWLALDPNDPETLYASVVHSAAGGIWVTHHLSDGTAAAWSRLAAPPRTEGHPFTLHVLDDGTLVCTYSGRRDASGAFTISSGVFVSTDGGATWTDRSDPGMLWWTKDLVVDPNDPSQSTWYVAVFSHWGADPNEVGGLYRTTDRGQSWDRISDLYRVESCTVDPADPDTLYLSTESRGLWVTHDLGDPAPLFSPVDGFPFAHPVRIFFEPGGTGAIWVTTFGGGLFRARPRSFVPPAGIPEPGFGLTEEAPPWPAAWPDGEAAGWYYVDNTDPAATDAGNPYGWPARPRKTIPSNVTFAPGSVVEVHGGPYMGNTIFHMPCTATEPCWIRGDGRTPFPIVQGTLNPRDSSYLILENLDFNGGTESGVSFTSSGDHLVVRNCLFRNKTWAHNSSGVGMDPAEGQHLTDVVVYGNLFAELGDWTTEVDQDFHGVTPSLWGRTGTAGTESSRIWVLHNTCYHVSGNCVQVNAGAGAGALEALHHVYIGANTAHHNRQAGFWCKQASDVIFSENIAFGGKEHGAQPGDGFGYQYNPNRLWFLFNEAFDNNFGFRQSDTTGGDPTHTAYFVGNVIHDNVHGLSSATHWGSPTGWAFSLWQGNQSRWIVDNTIWNTRGGIELIFAGPTTIAGNIVSGLWGGAEHLRVDRPETAAATQVDVDLFHLGDGPPRFRWSGASLAGLAAFQDASGQCAACVDGDPAFDDPGAQDFHIGSASAARNASTEQDPYAVFQSLYGLDIRRDRDGVARPQEAAWDMGALEHVPAHTVQITTRRLPAALLDEPWSAVLEATGGAAPLEWSVAAGRLPFGMQLDPASGEISGTPGIEGRYAFLARLTDGAADVAQRTLSIRVCAVRPVADVPPAFWAYRYVQFLLCMGVSDGCGVDPLRYCPRDPATRGQMAKFLLRARWGSEYDPPECTSPPFDDVECWRWFGPWVAELKAEGITTGCHGNDYCPFDPVTRAQMAAFLLRTLEGPDYQPPQCTTPPFDDVPCGKWYSDWVAELKARGITTGCHGNDYCPQDPVTRAQMAAFLDRAFTLGS